MTALDAATELRNETIQALEAMGIRIEYHHHEVAPSQHEIDMRYANALDMADQTITYRLIVKEVAAKNGVYATFMPKPLFGENGSGMHTHMSLFKDGRNQFFDGGDQYNLSPAGKQFIAGLLRHARELSAVFAQWVNSYKRLVPGFEAPVYVAWSQRNRSALIRIPLYKPGSEQATRAEIRCPDPACNPYLTFAALLHAGLEGIEKGYELEPPMETNLYHLTAEERREQGIVSLPETLGEAIDEFAGSRADAARVRRPHLRQLREAEAEGVGRVPRPAHAVGARPLPLACSSRERHDVQPPRSRPRNSLSRGRCGSTRGRPEGRSPSRRRRSARSTRPARAGGGGRRSRSEPTARRAARGRCRTSGTRPCRRAALRVGDEEAGGGGGGRRREHSCTRRYSPTARKYLSCRKAFVKRAVLAAPLPDIASQATAAARGRRLESPRRSGRRRASRSASTRTRVRS